MLTQLVILFTLQCFFFFFLSIVNIGNAENYRHLVLFILWLWWIQILYCNGNFFLFSKNFTNRFVWENWLIQCFVRDWVPVECQGCVISCDKSYGLDCILTVCNYYVFNGNFGSTGLVFVLSGHQGTVSKISSVAIRILLSTLSSSRFILWVYHYNCFPLITLETPVIIEGLYLINREIKTKLILRKSHYTYI